MIRRLVILAAMLAATGAQAAPPMLAGVNLSGAELNPASANRVNFDYVYPTEAAIDRVAADGMNAIRLPVLWERLQPDLAGGLDSAEMGRLTGIIHQGAARHLTIIVDIHGFGQYRGKPVGSSAVPDAAFARFWGLLAGALAGYSNVAFDLMNEPTPMSPAAWRDSAQGAIRAIRAAGARNLVLVPGANWDGAHSFTEGGAGSNAAALETLSDPGNNMAIEVHQYLDGNFSGTSQDCRKPDDSVATLAAFTAWARSHGRKGFLGEFGVSADPACMASMAAMLAYMRTNADVWMGWTYWAAGPWWGNYPFSVEPANGQSRPQMEVLKRAIAAQAGR